MNENMPKPSGETPFKPEYQEYIDENKGRGSLKIQASVAEDAFPLKDVFVDVSMIYKGKRYSIYNDTTDSSTKLSCRQSSAPKVKLRRTLPTALRSI